MNSREKEFLNSIKRKIKKYEIPTTIKEAVSHARNEFVEVEYNSGTTEIVDIGIEYFLCFKSAFYFIYNYAYIDLPGYGVIPFGLYYFQEESLKIAPHKKKLVFLKSRQTGISTLFSLYCFWKGNFHESESIDIVSTKQSKAQAFVQKTKATRKKLPPFLYTPVKHENMREMKWANGSQIVSEAASDRAGRGDSLSVLVLDELAHYQSDRLTRGIVAAAMPTLSRTGGSVIEISTPNGISGSGSYYYEQVNNLQLYGNSEDEYLVEIDWWEVPDIEGVKPYKGFNKILNDYIKRDYFNKPDVKAEAKKYFQKIEENWRDNEWLKKQHGDLGDILFKQEVLHSFIVGNDQVFSESTLEKVREKINKFVPVEENSLNGATVKGMQVWNYPEPKKRYIIGADVGSGTGKDFSTIQVMNVDDYEQVAEYKGKTSTKNLGRLIKTMARYYNQAYVVIEANGIGEAVFNEVYYSDSDPYNNVYKTKKSKNGVVRYTGWETTSKTRQIMLNNLIDWFSVDELLEQQKLKSPRLYAELTTWIWKNGRPDHPDSEGAHDDSIIAWGLCLYNRNKVTEYGESFFFAEDGEIMKFEEDDKKRSVNNLGFATTENEYVEDGIEKIQEESGVDLDTYKWLLDV